MMTALLVAAISGLLVIVILATRAERKDSARQAPRHGAGDSVEGGHSDLDGDSSDAGGGGDGGGE